MRKSKKIEIIEVAVKYITGSRMAMGFEGGICHAIALAGRDCGVDDFRPDAPYEIYSRDAVDRFMALAGIVRPQRVRKSAAYWWSVETRYGKQMRTKLLRKRLKELKAKK